MSSGCDETGKQSEEEKPEIGLGLPWYVPAI